MASGGPFYTDTTFWVAASIVSFAGLVAWKGGLKAVGGALDSKIKAIRTEIDEARALKDEADEMLLDYQRRHRAAEKEAEEIRARAVSDTEAMREQAKADIEAMIARRTRAAEAKIAQAEATAVKDVRAAAVDIAVDAATQLISTALPTDTQAELADSAIRDVSSRLN